MRQNRQRRSWKSEKTAAHAKTNYAVDKRDNGEGSDKAGEKKGKKDVRDK